MDTSSYGGSYKPSSTMSMQHLMALEVKPDDDDVGPVMNAVEQDERLGRLVVERNGEIL